MQHVSSTTAVTQPGRNRIVDRLVRATPVRFRQSVGRLLGSPIPRFVRASGVLFIHIPKNAGYSISQALYGRQVWHNTALYLREADPVFFERSVSFAVVRNPWDRTVSAYEYYRGGGTSLAPVGISLAEPVLQSFENFVRFLVANSEQLNVLDEAVWEQNLFVNDGDGNCIVDFLGRFEDLPGLETLLLEKRILRAPFQHLNASGDRAHKDYRNYYKTPALVDDVARCYRRDIDQFGYRFA